MPRSNKTIRQMSPTARRLAHAAQEAAKLTRFLDNAALRVQELESGENAHAMHCATFHSLENMGSLRADLFWEIADHPDCNTDSAGEHGVNPTPLVCDDCGRPTLKLYAETLDADLEEVCLSPDSGSLAILRSLSATLSLRRAQASPSLALTPTTPSASTG